ncbi:MAG: outer membrane receptor protein involved in Fe transport [Bacteroidia bacterium]
MRIQHSILLLALSILSISGFAQKVKLTGIVKDRSSTETLIGANVVSDGKTGVTTDLDGKYTLELTNEKHEISFSFIGYKSETRLIDLSDGNSLSLNISLNIQTNELDFVVISASQYEKSIAEETVSMDIVDEKLLRNNNATDVGEAVKKTPGVLIQDSQISIRGGSSYSYGIGSRTAVMMDGVSFMSPDLGEAQLGGAPLENVEQIEVIKGSSSVVYGSSALNGVVNVRTAWPKSAEPKTKATVYMGVYDTPSPDSVRWWGNDEVRNKMGFSFSHMRKIKNMDFIFGGNILNHRSYLQFADEFRGGFNFKTRFHNQKKRGMTYGLNGNFSAERSGRFFLSQNPVNGPLQSLQPSTDQYARLNLDPHFNYLDGSGNRHRLDMRYLMIKRIPFIGDATKPAVSHTATVNYQYQKRWRIVVLTAGLPLSLSFSHSNLYSKTRVTYSGAGYLQGEYKSKNKRLSAVVGGRYEILGVDDFTESSLPIFRSGFNYKVGLGTYFRGSFGQSYRLPTIAERFLDDELNSLIRVIPNSDLQPERGLGAELGLKQMFRLKKWVGYLDLAFFYQQYKQLVEYRFVSRFGADTVLFNGLNESYLVGLHPINVEDALITGMEFTFASKGKIGPIGVTALIGFTYNYPMNLDSAKSIGSNQYASEFFQYMFQRADSIPSQRLLQFRSRQQIVGDLELSYKNLSIGGAIFYGSFPEYLPGTAVEAINLVSGTVEGEEAMTAYAKLHQAGDLIFDARISYQVLKFMRVGFIVKNIGNKLYAIRPSKAEPIRNYTFQLQFDL